MLVALAVTLLLGFLEKAEPRWTGAQLSGRCLGGVWHDPRAVALCYSDIRLLYNTEDLGNGRLPYLDGCTPSGDRPCDEYPVLTMYAMSLTARIASGSTRFFFANALLLSIAAVVTTASLYLMVGRRALYVALAPTLLLYAFMNWDLIAVAFATTGTLAYLSRRYAVSGILIGLGTAAKLYPALLLVPFVLDRLGHNDRRGAARLTSASVGMWLVINLPFVLLAPRGWSKFFRFNATRMQDVDSLWYIGCRFLQPSSGGMCVSRQVVNVLAIGLVAAAATGLWYLKTRLEPDWPRWTFVFPLLILFLLTNKVYSPQYCLWLLPWIALAAPRRGPIPALPLFIVFSGTSIAVFVTRFLWVEWAFDLAVLARDFVLALFLVGWTFGRLLEGEDWRLPLQPALPAVR